MQQLSLKHQQRRLVLLCSPFAELEQWQHFIHQLGATDRCRQLSLDLGADRLQWRFMFDHYSLLLSIECLCEAAWIEAAEPAADTPAMLAELTDFIESSLA